MHSSCCSGRRWAFLPSISTLVLLFLAVALGQQNAVYRTWHVGSTCASSATIYEYDGSYPLGLCSPPDVINPSNPYTYTCQTGVSKSTLKRNVFDTFDATCSQAPVSTALVSHDFSCKRDQTTGYYYLTHCDPVPQALLSPPQLVVQTFPNSTCTLSTSTPVAPTRNIIMNACHPVYYIDPLLKGRKKMSDTGEILYYRKITYVSGPLGTVTWGQGVKLTSGGGASVGATSKVLTLLVTRYKFLDSHCEGEKKMSTEVKFTVQASITAEVLCRPDPLFPGKFYRVAPPAVPTTLPTSSPTNPTIRPSPRPSSIPTPRPSPRPSAKPSAVPTPATPNLPVVLDWYDRLKAAGTEASPAVLSAHSTFYQTLTTAGIISKIARLNTFSGNDATAAFIPLIPGGGSAADSANGGAYSGSYAQITGLTTAGGQMVNTGQRISHTNLLDTTSAASDGSNIHIGMYFLDTPPGGCRMMGVFRHTEYTRNYLLSDGPSGTFGWGISFPGNQLLTSGLTVLTGTSTGASRYVCSKGPTSSCSASPVTGVDRSQPSDHPVGVFGSFGSTTGVSTETLIAGDVCALSTRSAGYTIGYGLTAAEVTALNNAWNQLNADLGRT